MTRSMAAPLAASPMGDHLQLMNVLNALEDATLYKKDIYIPDID